jgi:hypothetical protein
MRIDQPSVVSRGVVTPNSPQALVSSGRYTLTSATQVSAKDALDDLLSEYYGVITRKLAAAGVLRTYTAQELKASFWPNMDNFLPPHGRLILGHDADGATFGVRHITTNPHGRRGSEAPLCAPKCLGPPPWPRHRRRRATSGTLDGLAQNSGERHPRQSRYAGDLLKHRIPVHRPLPRVL